MKKLLLVTIIILINSLTSVNAKEWFEFNSKELKIGINNYKLKVNLGEWGENQYFIIDVNQEKIIWSEQDENSSMIPYKIIPNGFEFIKAETDFFNILDDKKENVIERYYKVNNIIMYQISFENRKDSTIHKLKTNLIDFFDISKKFSCIAASCEDQILTDINDSTYGYDNYLQNLLSNKTIQLKLLPELKESYREKTGKVIFTKIK